MNKFEEEYARECPYCEERFIAKRLNQHYCSHRCKYTFNNRKRDSRDGVTKTINLALRRNWSILNDFLVRSGENRLRIPTARLEKAGYNFTYYTHSKKQNDAAGIVLYDVMLIDRGEHFDIYRIKQAA